MKVLFVVLSILDFVFTAALLAKAGVELELNPVAASLYSIAGVSGLFVLKSSAVALVLSIFHGIKTTHPGTAQFVCYLACGLSALAVILQFYCNMILYV